jgi:DNA-binding response OmpR family regulator
VDASDGFGALDVAERERPDLVLLDISLPGLSGPDVCRRMRQAPATASTPVLLMTGFAREDGRSAAEAAGAQGFIEKPFSPAALLARIEAVLYQRQPVATG